MEIVRIEKGSSKSIGAHIAVIGVVDRDLRSIALKQYDNNPVISRDDLVKKISDWIEDAKSYAHDQKHKHKMTSDDYIVTEFTGRYFLSKYDKSSGHERVAYDFGMAIASKGPDKVTDEQCLTLFDLTTKALVGIHEVSEQGEKMSDGFIIDTKAYLDYAMHEPHFTTMIEEIPGVLYVVG